MHIRPPVSAASMVAVLTVMALELLRVSGPLLDATPGGVPGKGLATLGVFIAPVLAWPVARMLAGRAVAVTVAVLVGLRLALQIFPAPPYALGLAGAVVGMITLVVAVSRAEGGAAAMGVLSGVALDLGVRSLSGTWDVIWQPGAVPWLVTGATCAAAAGLTWWTLRQPAAVPTSGRRAWVVGPFLGLAVLFLANPAFAASQAAVSAPVASGSLILGALFAVVVAGEARHTAVLGGTVAGVAATAALTGGTAVALLSPGPQALIALVAGLVSAALLLARALGGTGLPGVGHAGLGAGLGFLVTVLPYQAHYELPLGVPNVVWPLAGVALLAVAGLRAAPAGRSGTLTHEFHLAGGCAIALLAPVIALVTNPAPVAKQAPRGQVKLFSWNVHYGVSGAPAVDPEAIARVIEDRDPDVIMLQEVSRGWPVGGGLDLAEWLARRLRLDYVWAPAADGQFGNMILSKVPLTDVGTGRLPYGAGPMKRSYAAGTVAGRLRVMTTHLQHRDGNTPTRLRQIESLLAAWGGVRPAVIAGDLNFKPSWPVEPAAFTRAGFTSAQDVTGHGAEFTAPTSRPDNRVDWIWGTRDLAFRDFAILDEVTTSDHFPLEATVTLPDRRTPPGDR
ncbi:endonuclease/exonuclease/phosphatase family protein [Streptosporangium sp. KLBMP 9127]|nr:endonuclease/exonuclease/phosphatase family protein [Streptosporangium sp. KLBMP 9127]